MPFSATQGGAEPLGAARSHCPGEMPSQRLWWCWEPGATGLQPMAGDNLAVGTWGLLPHVSAAPWEGARLWHRLREGCCPMLG